ncbi:hypothetical protein CW751_07520 [Brumimicrobium salinarum]|uniref:Uncharacterized protein n=1 Tax=Brumimicrobium salinarum TaxID=2058658 RepID=A0A2I0R356_9FLAO|nr:hypothetical protein [Brumimicrobium salinarum]PKR81006.1 hypothetical protein CW751_07520 [Brumimicrobium salinarum]
MKLKEITYLTVLIFFMSIIFGCDKEELPQFPTENTPVFNVKGSIGQTPIEIQAGENDAVMVANHTSLNNVRIFNGDLGNAQQSIKIKIHNADVNIPGIDIFNDATSYMIAEEFGNTKLLEIKKEDFENNSEIESLNWFVDDKPENTPTLTLYEPGKYKICVDIQFINGAKAKTCNTILVGYRKNTDLDIYYEFDQNYNFQAEALTSSATVNNVKWFINDDFYAEGVTLNASELPNTFKLKAQVEFSNSVTLEKEIYINSFDSYFSVEDFTKIGHHTAVIWDAKAKFDLLINGTTYTSVGDNPEESLFEIDEIVEYESGETNQNVKLLKGSLNTLFRNNTTGEVVPSDLNIEIGVGY